MVESYVEAKQKEKDYNLYWRSKGYFVRPHSIPFSIRWIAGLTKELDNSRQKELEQNRRKFELNLQVMS